MTIIAGHIFLPHKANWTTLPVLKRVWETQIVQFLSGGELRQSLRAVPRRSLAFSVLARSQAERSRLESRLDAALQSGLACAPLYGRGCPLAAPAAAAANSLVLAQTAWRWQAGDTAVLIAGETIYDALAVTAVSVDGLTLTLDGPLANSWPAAELVRPLIFGKLTADKEAVLTDEYAAFPLTITELVSARAVQIGVTPVPAAGIGQQTIGTDNVVG